jgi:hypothetical protein
VLVMAAAAAAAAVVVVVVVAVRLASPLAQLVLTHIRTCSDQGDDCALRALRTTMSGDRDRYEMQDLHVEETLPQLIGLSESYMMVYERQDVR